MVNVLGDCFCASLINETSAHLLAKNEDPAENDTKERGVENELHEKKPIELSQSQVSFVRIM